MTVCVAAVAQGMIFAASDRMITAGDIQYQPNQKKIFAFTQSVFAMVAGDVSFAMGLLSHVQAIVAPRVSREPDNWWGVEEIGNLCVDQYTKIRQREVNVKLLAPLGLTLDTFISRQKELDPGLVKQIASELINAQDPGVSLILAGVDDTGAHLFTFHDGNLICCDATGFAAIGAGYWHAESQFMLARHSNYEDAIKTAWLTYLSKRTAEVAPGVGPETDMHVIGPQKGSLQPIIPEAVVAFENAYQGYVKAMAAINKKSHDKVKRFFDTLAENSNDKTQAAETGDGKASTHVASAS